MIAKINNNNRTELEAAEERNIMSQENFNTDYKENKIKGSEDIENKESDINESDDTGNEENKIERSELLKSEQLKEYALSQIKKSKEYTIALIKWIVLAVATGLFVGAFATLFAKCMNAVTGFRAENNWIVCLLPIAGILIVCLYRITDTANDKGTNLVISSISSGDDVPLKMAPLIFLSTVITHLFGGSAGREGAALQLGGSLGNFLGKIVKLNDRDKKVIIMCGMSAAFSALFGTPMAAAIFSIEVVSVGIMYYSALVPCIFSAIIASRFALDMGINPNHFNIEDIPELTIVNGLKTIVLAVVCAFISVVFCVVIHRMNDLLKRYLKNGYLRVFVCSIIIVALGFLLNTKDYFGAGVDVISRAIGGEADTFAFLLKILFTALTLGAGFKGGEIVPSFFVGATLGCILGGIIGLSPSLCAGLGMISVFCGVTNCPIASLLISFELFGDDVKMYFLIVIAVSYMMSGYHGLYREQKIMYSKSKTEFINTKAK